MSVNRSRLNWGVFFIVLGAVPLAVNVGLIDRNLVAQLATLGPVALIALGIGLILRFGPAHALGGLMVAGTFGLILGALISGGVHGSVGLACNNTSAGSTPVTVNGDFLAGGQLNAELSCVDLTLDGQAGTAWMVSAGSDGNRQPTIDQKADSLFLRSEPERFFGPGPRLAWHVTVPQQVPVSIDLTTNAATGHVNPGAAQLNGLGFTLNASDVDFDLSALTSLGSLGGTLNASSGTLVLPASLPALNAGLTLNASSLTICAAPTANLQFQVSETLSSNNFSAAGLTKSGDLWVTPGATAGVPPISLHVTTNVSSITLDRTGGCNE
jgi:hypothetical protein